jgi:dipeptidyl aminopeptidase/acylaminoacyl peptidase
VTTRFRSTLAAASLVAAILAAALAGGCGEDDPVSPDPLVVANDQFPTWSPVADTIAFLRARATSEGPAGVYVVGSDGGTPRLVTSGELHALRYAPDGRRFASVFHGNLLTIDAVNGARTLVIATTGPVLWPDWSPDGTRIVYSRGDSTTGVRPDSAGIHIVDVASGTDAAMRDTSGAIVFGAQPVWSPMDSLIAFYRGGSIDVWDERTHLVERLHTPPAGYVASNPIWIEGGRRLLVAESGPSVRTVVVDVPSRQATAWPLFLGGLRAIAPGDTAFVYRDLDSTITSPPTYVLYRRGLTDVAGTTIRRLTRHLP